MSILDNITQSLKDTVVQKVHEITDSGTTQVQASLASLAVPATAALPDDQIPVAAETGLPHAASAVANSETPVAANDSGGLIGMATKFLDTDGDGNISNEISGLVGKLFNR